MTGQQEPQPPPFPGPFELPPHDSAALFTVVFPRNEALTVVVRTSSGTEQSWVIPAGETTRLHSDGGVLIDATGGSVDLTYLDTDDFHRAVLDIRP